MSKTISLLLVSLLLLLLVLFFSFSVEAKEEEEAKEDPNEPPPVIKYEDDSGKIPLEERKCIHDTHINPENDEMDREYERQGKKRPISYYVTPWHRRSSRHHNNKKKNDQDEKPEEGRQEADPELVVEGENREASAQAIGGMRVVFKLNNLYDTSKYCQYLGQFVDNGQGGTINCTSELDFLTDERRRVLIEEILPESAKILKRILQVSQMSGNLVTPSTSSCGSSFNISSEDTTTGTANADLVVYVTAAPCSTCAAFAGYCSVSSTGRPLVGRMLLDPSVMISSWNNQSVYMTRYVTLTVIHELSHILGWSSGKFLRGHNVQTISRRGETVTVLGTKYVNIEARKHFNCSQDNLTEIENSGSGVGSHLERHGLGSAGGCLMCSGVSFKRICPIFLAGFNDFHPEYSANMSAAEYEPWGRNAGCSFITEACSSSHPRNGKEWCSENPSNSSICAHDRLGTGYCTSNSNLGSACYFANTYSNRRCFDPLGGTNSTTYGYTYTKNSRCFYGSGIIATGYSTSTSTTTRCFETRCVNKTYVQYRILSGTWNDCPTDGSEGSSVISDSAFKGTVFCEPYAKLCDDPSLPCHCDDFNVNCHCNSSSIGLVTTTTTTAAATTSTTAAATTSTSALATSTTTGSGSGSTAAPPTTTTDVFGNTPPPPTTTAAPSVTTAGAGKFTMSLLLAAVLALLLGFMSMF